MKITKERTSPTAYKTTAAGVEFVAIFNTISNNTNGHPRREVVITWKDPRGISGQCCRSFIITLFYESEREAAEELAQKIAESWNK